MTHSAAPPQRPNMEGKRSVAVVYENPANGYQETSSSPTLWTFVFGPFYFAQKGIWRHVVLSAMVALFTAGISWLFYPFFAESIVRNHYMRMGWKPVGAFQPATTGGFTLEVAGESHYQGNLEMICRGRSEDGHQLRVEATLILDDENPYDSNAVRVDIQGLPVGHLSRKEAVRYRRSGAGEALVDAEIRGGWDRGGGDRGHFGVWLDL